MIPVKIKLILGLNSIASLIYIISLFLPYVNKYQGSELILYYGFFMTLQPVGLGLIGFAFILISTFFTYKVQLKKAIILKGIGFSMILTNLIYLFAINYFIAYLNPASMLYLDVGFRVLIISMILFLITIILEGIWQKSILTSKFKK